jgi:hypothetical protein
MNKNTKKTEFRPNKRRIANEKEVKFDLKKELPHLFEAFNEALSLYESEIVNTPPPARGRGMEASYLQSKMLQCIQKYFPEKWMFGKYKRFILRVGEYNVLFKKLNRYGKPMNIPTTLVQAISNQLTLPLFGSEPSTEDPILFFGYQKDRFGNVINPQLVYLDENRVKWVITEEDIVESTPLQLPIEAPKIAAPTLKKGKENDRKAS